MGNEVYETRIRMYPYPKWAQSAAVSPKTEPQSQRDMPYSDNCFFATEKIHQLYSKNCAFMC